MKKLISAEEAKKQTDQGIALDAELEWDLIVNKIEAGIKGKKTQITSCNSINPSVKKELEKLGYKVKVNFDQRDGTWVIISWN